MTWIVCTPRQITGNPFFYWGYIHERGAPPSTLRQCCGKTHRGSFAALMCSEKAALTLNQKRDADPDAHGARKRRAALSQREKPMADKDKLITIDRKDLTDGEVRIIQRQRLRREALKTERAAKDSTKVAIAWINEAEGAGLWLYKRRLIVQRVDGRGKQSDRVFLHGHNDKGVLQFTVAVKRALNTDEEVEAKYDGFVMPEEKKDEETKDGAGATA